METKKHTLHGLNLDHEELRIDTKLIEELTAGLCRQTRCNTVAEAYSKIRKQSNTRIRISGQSYYTEIFSVPMSLVKQWTKSIGFTSVPGLYSNLDLDRGKYEGGFKVWESTRDLVNFISQDSSIMSSLSFRGGAIRALELGAGAALPSLALLSRLIGDTNFKSKYRIHIQDFNWEVLASLTLMNFAINLPCDYLKALLDTRCLRLFHGDWSNFRKQSNYKYELIIMSEVIYNSDNFESLHNLLTRHLKPHGYIVLATKDTYFGLSGGLYPWLDYLESRGMLQVLKVHKISIVNIPRSILIMGWRSCR